LSQKRLATRPLRRSRIMAAVIAPAVAIFVYAGALNNSFVYDDFDTVVANPSLAEPLQPAFILVHSPFRPVVNVSYAIDRVIWGFRPFGYHLTNILLHAAVVALFYLLLLRALADVGKRLGDDLPTPADETRLWTACICATILAVHPVLSEAVAYVSGRSELLCGLFFVTTLLCARAAIVRMDARAEPRTDRRTVPSKPVGWMLGAAIAGLLALLSKEVAVALPVVVLAYDWLVIRGPRELRMRRLRLFFLPLAIVTAILAGYRLMALMRAGPEPFHAPHLNLLTQAIVIWRYVILLLLPVDQGIMHSVRQVQSVADSMALAAVFGLIAAAVLAFRVRRSFPLAAFGCLWFLAALAPSSSVVSLREGMAEHRVYVATAGLAVAMAGVVRSQFHRIRLRRSRSVTMIELGAAVAAVLAVLTVARVRVWESPILLWTEAVSRAPGMWEPHYALGDALRDAGRCGDAVTAYREVVRLRPGHRDGQTNLGICLAQTGKHAEAETAFRTALEIDPAYPRGYTNLAALAVTVGDYDKARQMYLETLRVDPRNVFARMQLARLYEEVFKDYHSAARMCGEARALQPFTPGVVECVDRNQRLAIEKDGGR
jgi:tetratricopeptide (TPR) repeat protein